MEVDLSLVPKEYLIIELTNRFDHIVIVGCKQNTDSEGIYCHRWKGNNHMCLGLMTDISMTIVREQISKERPIKPEDG